MELWYVCGGISKKGNGFPSRRLSSKLIKTTHRFKPSWIIIEYRILRFCFKSVLEVLFNMFTFVL